MSDQVQGSTPGAGARAEYERRRANRLKRDPESAAPAHETAWLAGAEGEAKLGQRLNDDALLVGGVGVLHDLVLPGKRANIDHIVIGPTGVTVIDAKAWTGELWVGRKVIGRGRRGRRAPIDGLQRQIHRVCTVLAQNGRDDVPVEGAVCFVNDNRGLAGNDCQQVDGIAVGATAPVSRRAMRPGRYSVPEVVDLMQMLTRAFTVAGGECRPTAPRAAVATAAPKQDDVRPRLSYRQRKLVRRASFGVLRAVLYVALGLVGLAFASSLLSSTAGHIQSAVTPGSAAQLIHPHRAEFRALAERRARGPVRGPRVTENGVALTLTYRRGRRCRVTVSVARPMVGNTLGPPRIASTGCRRRA